MKSVLVSAKQLNSHTTIKWLLVICLSLSILGAQLYYVIQSGIYDKQLQPDKVYIDHNHIFIKLIKHLTDNDGTVVSMIKTGLNSKDFDQIENILADQIGKNSNLFSNKEKTGLYYYAIGYYYLIKNEHKYQNIANEIFYLGYIQCMDSVDYCIKILNNTSPPNLSLEKEKEIIIKNNKSLENELPIDKLCRIFDTLSICPKIEQSTTSMANGNKETKQSFRSDKHKTANNSQRTVLDTLANQQKQDDEFSFIPDYKPETTNKAETKKTTYNDLINDKQQRYDNLHQAILSLFESNAHGHNINKTCYYISSKRISEEETGIIIELQGPRLERNADCPLNFTTIKTLTDCLVDVLQRYEKIAHNEFQHANYTIQITHPKLEKGNFYCEEQLSTRLNLAEKKISFQEKPSFSVKITSTNFFYTELDMLNEAKRQYKINSQQQKNRN